MERRLAAILAADVLGYSRMIRINEEGTLLALQALRTELIDPKIDEHRGNIVKLMGDGMLVEFASVVDAVLCGADMQQAIARRNTEMPEAERIVFRIGNNLGDVGIDGDDIHGDGVNVASRLEAMSEPGGKLPVRYGFSSCLRSTPVSATVWADGNLPDWINRLATM